MLPLHHILDIYLRCVLLFLSQQKDFWACGTCYYIAVLRLAWSIWKSNPSDFLFAKQTTTPCSPMPHKYCNFETLVYSNQPHLSLQYFYCSHFACFKAKWLLKFPRFYKESGYLLNGVSGNLLDMFPLAEFVGFMPHNWHVLFLHRFTLCVVLKVIIGNLVWQEGVEPSLTASQAAVLAIRRLSQCGIQVSNLWPPVCKTGALPLS